MNSAATAQQPPLRGLYTFVREHLAIANGIVLASGTLVAVLDFLAPRLSLLPRLVYSATAALLALMVVAAVAPSFVERALLLIGLAFKREAGGPLWRRPAWQALAALLAVVTVVGFASVAKAQEGGLIAGSSATARDMQSTLLRLSRDSAEIKAGVVDANAKLDALVGDSKDPQRELVARGFTYNDSGLMRAIEIGDARAVGLFAKAGFRASFEGPLRVLLANSTPWKDEVAALLPRSMFARDAACAGAQTPFHYALDNAQEKVAVFARLCDREALALSLRDAIKRQESSGPPPNEAHAEERAAKRRNLELVRKAT